MMLLARYRMRSLLSRAVIVAVMLMLAPVARAEAAAPDPRLITTGLEIPSRGYADQPYVVQTDDGGWLCVMTTGAGKEGQPGQTVVSLRSTDRGRTWSEPLPLEPDGGPEASYAVLLKVPGGRVYAFYNHNTDDVREVQREDGGVFARVDSLGHYVFRFTDDHGRTWSSERHEVPVREFACDRDNVYGGRIRFFWNVGRPLILGDEAILPFHKVGAMGDGFFAASEGVFLASRSLLTEKDPSRITFETRPDGDVGLRTPPGGGRVSEEQSIVQLSDGSLVCVYRTIDGWPATATSRDAGRTWSEPTWLTRTPGGRRIKQPRAATFAWNCGNGMMLLWFHNHGGRFIGQLGAAGRKGRSPYDDRNPAWLMAGREIDTPSGRSIEWSQPEIVLYDDDPFVRMSYPDLIEDHGRFFITETQKNLGRVHEIPRPILDGLFAQWDTRSVATAGLLLDVAPGDPAAGAIRMPPLPTLVRRDPARPDHGMRDLRAGFALDLWLELDSAAPGQPLLDTRTDDGRGILVSTLPDEAFGITLADGRQIASWQSDPGTLAVGRPQHVVVTVDGGPKIITFVVDGALCDGGDHRQFGWGRYGPALHTPDGVETVTLASAVRQLRVYDRPLRTSEAVGNHRAGPPPAAAGGRSSARRSAQPALLPVEDVPGLPRVLLIGDSISIGYTLAVREQLRGKANVHRPLTNCGPTTNGVAHLDAWLATGGADRSWDVIHFNWGLHDLKYMGPKGEFPVDPAAPTSRRQVAPEDYRRNLEALVERLKATGAKLVWRTTTPVPRGAKGRVPEDVAIYNQIAHEVMARAGVPVHDLGMFAEQRLDRIQKRADVHFTPEGSEVLATDVTRVILDALQRPVHATP